MVESRSGGSHGVLLINDANEALGQYLNPKEAKLVRSVFFSYNRLDRSRIRAVLACDNETKISLVICYSYLCVLYRERND